MYLWEILTSPGVVEIFDDEWRYSKIRCNDLKAVCQGNQS